MRQNLGGDEAFWKGIPGGDEDEPVLPSPEPTRTPALVASGVLHAGLLGVIFFGLPSWNSKPLEDPTPPVVMVDIAQIAEKTNPPPPAPRVQAPPKPEAKPEPPKVEARRPPEPEPAPAPAAAAPPPPPPQSRPEPPPPALPPPRPAEAPPEPAPTPAPKPPPPTPKVAEAPPPPEVRPRAKPTPPAPDPPPAPTQSNQFDPTRLAALLNKMQRPADSPRPAPSPTPAPQAAAPSQPVPQHNVPSNPGAPMTISEIDAIRQQYERCWSPPIGAKDAGDLKVRVRVTLNPDGQLQGRPELMEERSDRFWRAAADSVLRAVIRCSPLQNLPPTKYERWRIIELTFNPKDMIG